jgi:hypothetical protein
MPTTLEQYREAKNSYLKLRNQAKKELIAHFNELAAELLQVQKELRDDFGEKVAIPSKVKKPKSAPKPPEVEPSPKEQSLQKQIEAQRKKLSAAQAANKPVKAFEDRIYELEDALRLLKN